MSGPKSSAEARIRNVVGGRFDIRRLVASGGMANVYEAQDLSTGQLGALKLLRSHCRNAPEAVERLTREAAAATRVCGPHIVQTLDAGKLVNGEPYIFMELLSGQPLDKLLELRGRLPIGEALELVEQAAEGLCAAHAAGVLHRDIKPANLFISSGVKGSVKLLDFGVSKLPDQLAITREGVALGTFSYMPPEQMLGAKRVDQRADLYSLGIVLYLCIAGRLPFVAKSLHALMARMEKNDYVPVSRIRPDAPPEVDAILGRTIRADPNERYDSAQALRDVLARLCRKSLPLRTVDVGGTPPGAPETGPRRPSPPMQQEKPKPMTVAAVAPRTGSLLVETVVPKTHRPG